MVYVKLVFYVVSLIVDYCAALGFKVFGGRKNEDGKQVAIVSEIVPGSIAEKDIKLMVGEWHSFF